jgi:hypothetical protein
VGDQTGGIGGQFSGEWCTAGTAAAGAGWLPASGWRSGCGGRIACGWLSTWVKDERRRTTASEVHGEKPLEAAERAELQRLRRQVADLEKDNAFLVKASAYFAAMQKNRPGSI